MERVEYQVRAHVLDKTRTFRLSEHELEIEEEGAAPVRVELSSISEIRLRYQPTKVQSNRYDCSFIAAGKKYTFISMHFRGLLDFEDRAAGYSAFCRELCIRVARRNPGLRCVGGHSALVFYTGLTFGILGFVAFIAFMVAFWEAMRAFHFMRVLMLIFLTFLLVKYFIGNRPRLFDPLALPADALPKQL